MVPRGRAWKATGIGVFRGQCRLSRLTLLSVTASLVLHGLSLGLWKSQGIVTAPLLLTSREEFPNCISESCVQNKARTLARVWERHPLPNWCGGPAAPPPAAAASPDTNSTNGLVLIKVPKSASSTIAGVVLRIAELHNCPVRWQHAQATEVVSLPHNRSNTFWIAPVRHPYPRALSSVYYHAVSLQAGRGGRGQPADAHVVRQLERIPANYISEYTRVSVQQTSAAQIVKEILDHYHFLLVVEEMEASLVVWAWLSDLTLEDMVTMSSKTAGSWYATGRGRCVSLIKPVITPAVSSYWQEHGTSRHLTDRLLHATAVHSLHQTIQRGMGQTLFAQRLAEFRALQAYVQNVCAMTFNESAPCSPSGVYQPKVATRACYLRDFGCGHECVDEAVKLYSQSLV